MYDYMLSETPAEAEASARRWRASRRRSCSWRRAAGRRCSRRNAWSCCSEAVGVGKHGVFTMGKAWEKPGKTWENMGNHGKTWENHGKRENHGKTMGKTMGKRENHGKTMGKTMGKPMGKAWRSVRAVDFYRDFSNLMWYCFDDHGWSLTMVYECLWHDIWWYLMKWLVYPWGKSQGAKHEKRCRCSLIFQCFFWIDSMISLAKWSMIVGLWNGLWYLMIILNTHMLFHVGL